MTVVGIKEIRFLQWNETVYTKLPCSAVLVQHKVIPFLSVSSIFFLLLFVLRKEKSGRDWEGVEDEKNYDQNTLYEIS